MGFQKPQNPQEGGECTQRVLSGSLQWATLSVLSSPHTTAAWGSLWPISCLFQGTGVKRHLQTLQWQFEGTVLDTQPKFLYVCCWLYGVLPCMLVFLLFFYLLFPTHCRETRIIMFFLHENETLNVKPFSCRTVRQVAQEQFFLMCTRCCMGHRPLLFFITLLFTVLGVRHFYGRCRMFFKQGALRKSCCSIALKLERSVHVIKMSNFPYDISS